VEALKQYVETVLLQMEWQQRVCPDPKWAAYIAIV
jgi:hypothetical protein